MLIRELLLPEFDQEMVNTRKMLALVPETALDYKPHGKSMSMGRLAGHVAEMPMWAKTTMETDLLELQPGMESMVMTSTLQILEMFDRYVNEAKAAIGAASDEDLMRIWTMKFAGNPVFSMPKYNVIRNMVLNHLVHHRAQLGVYLRLNDVELPGMYGPSADEMKFWQQPGQSAQA